MPKFITYQRPAPVNKSSWHGNPGASFGKPGKRGPRSAPATRKPAQDAMPKLPGPPKLR